MQAAAIIGHIEIRTPFALIKNEKIKATYLWFKIDENTVGHWEDCEMMTPQWCLTIFTRAEAIQEIKDKVTNGEYLDDWKLLSTTEPELQSLVEIDTREQVGLY